MRKKVLITVAAIFFIALNATVFTDAAKTSTVTLSSIFKSAFATSEGGSTGSGSVDKPDLDKACPYSSTKTCVVSYNGTCYTVENTYSSAN